MCICRVTRSISLKTHRLRRYHRAAAVARVKDDRREHNLTANKKEDEEDERKQWEEEKDKNKEEDRNKNVCVYVSVVRMEMIAKGGKRND